MTAKPAECGECRRRATHILIAEGDLKHAVQRAVRRPTQSNRDLVIKRQKQLARSKEIATQHTQDCEVVSESEQSGDTPGT